MKDGKNGPKDNDMNGLEDEMAGFLDEDAFDEAEAEAKVERPLSYQFALHYQTAQRMRVAMALSLLGRIARELLDVPGEWRNRYETAKKALPKTAKKEPANGEHPSDKKIRNALAKEALAGATKGKDVTFVLSQPTQNAVSIYADALNLEARIVNFMVESAKNHCQAWDWLVGIKGIGPRVGGMLVSLIDITRCPTVSSLWRYAGQAVIDGKAERRRGWQTYKIDHPDWTDDECKDAAKLHFNMRLKKTCFLASRQLVMAGTEPYVGVYRKAKEDYLENRKEWQVDKDGKKIKGYKLHCDLAARRKMVKILLQHLWIEWRTAAGLPTNEPYVQAHMGHAKIIPSRTRQENQKD